MGSAESKVMRWELQGKVPQTPWAPSFYPEGGIQQELQISTSHMHWLSVAALATLGATEWQQECAAKCEQTALPRGCSGEASRSGPKGSSLWFALWDIRSDRHVDRSWLVSWSCSLHLWCSSSDLVELHSWCCCKQLCTAGHQVSTCKYTWRLSCHQQSVFRRSVEVGPSFLEVGIDFPVP